MASPRNPNEVQIQDDEFTKEQVLALLRDTTETGNYNTRGKIERMAHIIKRLKACVEWFQKAEETHVQEKETLQAIISKLGKEESSKQVTSLKEDDTYHKLQVYNSSLQQYNVILQTDLEFVRDRLTCAEREKSLILENLASVSGHNKSLQCQLASSQASQDDAIRQKHLLLSEVTNLQSELDKQVAHSQKLDEEGYGKSSESLEERIQILEQQLLEGESLRKKLHNTILELKGNIRVFCRVRPLLPDDAGQNEARVIAYPTSTNVELIHNGNNYLFSFDKVFNHEASQGEIFLEISELVHSVFDGFKVCIFAYGQTGSGKTYTMMGGPENPEQKGLIPRSLDLIFKTSQLLVAQGWKYKMQISMLEIVSETIQDLLSTSKTSCMQFVRADSVTPGKRYNIKHDANGSTHVSDLTIVDVCSAEEISSLLQQANQSRSVGKTNMNEESSRSHFVFTLRISGVNEKTGQQVHGVLNLIDLAGCERVSKSGATGDRLKETQAINKSLSALTDVISALAKKEDHVPFRNSKLTYLLQPCLEGDAKALMFVNVSPDPSSSGESLCSLRFATRVNACELGRLKRQGDKLQGSSRKRKEAL